MTCNHSYARDCSECNEPVCRGGLAREEPDETDYYDPEDVYDLYMDELREADG